MTALPERARNAAGRRRVIVSPVTSSSRCVSRREGKKEETRQGIFRAAIETRHKRLLRLETVSQGETIVLTEEQMQLLERHSVDFRCRHIESSRPGELLNQDTFYWGSLKGVGKVYVQVVVDVFCSLAFAKVYTSKMPITACDLLYDRVLPFYEALGVEVGSQTRSSATSIASSRTTTSSAVTRATGSRAERRRRLCVRRWGSKSCRSSSRPRRTLRRLQRRTQRRAGCRMATVLERVAPPDDAISGHAPGKIIKLTTGGVIVGQWATEHIQPSAIAVVANGDIYVTNFYGSVFRWTDH